MIRYAESGQHSPQTRTRVAVSASIAVYCFALAMSTAWSAEPIFPTADISVEEQNRMMESYCEICHMDRSFNGGLSLEHFDAATVSPGLATMLASKFTTGVPPERIMQAASDADIAEEIEQGKAMGAPSVMGIAGLPLPSDAEIN